MRERQGQVRPDWTHVVSHECFPAVVQMTYIIDQYIDLTQLCDSLLYCSIDGGIILEVYCVHRDLDSELSINNRLVDAFEFIL